MLVAAEGKRPRTMDGTHPSAKRPRLAGPLPAPDPSAYGRSTSDPPYSLQRRLANAANMPINMLDGRLVFPPQTEPRQLQSIRSGPARCVSLCTFCDAISLSCDTISPVVTP